MQKRLPCRSRPWRRRPQNLSGQKKVGGENRRFGRKLEKWRRIWNYQAWRKIYGGQRSAGMKWKWQIWGQTFEKLEMLMLPPFSLFWEFNAIVSTPAATFMRLSTVPVIPISIYVQYFHTLVFRSVEHTNWLNPIKGW